MSVQGNMFDGRLSLNVRQIRSEMGMSQSELAATLGIGVRAVQSYEQGWRNPPEMVQRMLLLLLIVHRNGAGLSGARCWEQKGCPPQTRESCVAYRTRQGHLCWFLTGTVCEAKRQKSWADKLRMCLGCSFLQVLLDPCPAEVAPCATAEPPDR